MASPGPGGQEIAATVAPDTHSFGVVASTTDTKLGVNVGTDANATAPQAPRFAPTGDVGDQLPDLDELLLTGVTIALVAPTDQTSRWRIF